MLNKRGDIAMTLLVFIVLVAVGLVIFGFLGFDSHIRERVENLRKPVEKVEFTQQYIIRQVEIIGKQSIEKGGDVKANFINIAVSRDFGSDSTGNFFRKIREGDFEFYLLDAGRGLYQLEISDIFIVSHLGNNEVERNFDLSLRIFDKGRVYFVETDLQSVAATYYSSQEAGREGLTLFLGKEQIMRIGGEQHSLTLLDFYEKGILVRIQSDPIEIYIPTGEPIKLDINKDNFYDGIIELVSVSKENRQATIIYKDINEETNTKSFDVSFHLPDRSPPKSSSRDPISPDELAWVDKLPERPEMPTVEYKSCWEDCPCGPTALYEAFQDLGREVSPCEINEQRKGGFRRGFLSLFSSRAKDITWRSEIVKIAEGYGYEVEVIKGKKATFEMAREKSTSDSVVIMHTSLDSRWPQRYFTQHYEIYDTEIIKEMKTQYSSREKYDWSSDPLYGEELIHRLYVIKKSSIQIS
ncbi:MAG: hypothetical protein Q8Q31_01345 [Nanoarchaeota archaeon]|nr:hypothetical protein [Nanoarchaeota archaeon]